MPLTEVDGGISQHEQMLANSLAACTRWQEECGVSTDEQAMARIYFHSLPPPQNKSKYQREEMQAYRPYAIIATSDREGYSLTRVAAEAWDDSGVLFLLIELNTPEELESDHQELMRRFGNFLGKIMARSPDDDASFKGLVDLFGQSDYLAGSRITLADYDRCPEEKVVAEGDFVFGIFRISWGNLNA